MFWRFGGYASISTVDTLLDKPEVTLEDLLDEPEVIQELKQQNNKLIEYLREDHVLKRLMDYVTAPSLVNDDEDDHDANEKEPAKDAGAETASAEQKDEKDKEEKDVKESDSLKDVLDPDDLDKVEKTRLKHAYVACEILSSETWSILESMMESPSYLRDFWGFVRRPPPLDSIQASYFTKVNETLLDKKTEEMLDFLKSLDGIVAALLQHVDNPMVMDLLLKIISLEKADGGQGTVDWLQSQNLIPTLLSFLSPDHPGSVQTSAGDFLKAIITISANATPNDQSCIGPNSLTRQLVSPESVQQLINAMLKGGNPLTVGVGIVIEVIRKNNSDYDPEHFGRGDSMPTPYDPIYLGSLLRLFAQHIPDFMALIQSSQHAVHDGNQLKTVDRGRLSSAWGAKIEPLGFDRFKTCELMAELLHCSNMGLLNEPGSEEYIHHRNAERERLIREGFFEHDYEDHESMDHNDTTADFTNGSVMDSGSPEDHKSEMIRAGEEDGLEDVGSSGVLVGKDGDSTDANKDNSAPSEKTPEGPSQAGHENKDVEMSNSSPGATGLADQVSEIKLKSEDQDEKGGLASDEQDQPVVSGQPEDVPAPLFASKEQPTESTTQPAEQRQNAPAAIEPTKESGRTNDGGAEDPAEQYIQYDPDGRPVVGDYLKIMFVENKVVPTILVSTSRTSRLPVPPNHAPLGLLLSIPMEQLPS